MTSVISHIQSSIILVLQHLQRFVLHAYNLSLTPPQIGYNTGKLLIELPPVGDITINNRFATDMNNDLTVNSSLAQYHPITETLTGNVKDILFSFGLVLVLVSALLLFTFKLIFWKWSRQGDWIEVKIELPVGDSRGKEIGNEFEMIQPSTFNEIVGQTLGGVDKILFPQLTTITGTNSSDDDKAPNEKSEGKIVPYQPPAAHNPIAWKTLGNISLIREVPQNISQVFRDQAPTWHNPTCTMMMANESVITLTDATSSQGISNTRNDNLNKHSVLNEGEEEELSHHYDMNIDHTQRNILLRSAESSSSSRPSLLQNEIMDEFTTKTDTQLKKVLLSQPREFGCQLQFDELGGSNSTNAATDQYITARTTKPDSPLDIKSSSSPLEEIREPITPEFELELPLTNGLKNVNSDGIDISGFNHNHYFVTYNTLLLYHRYTPSQLWDSRPLLMNSASSSLSSSFVSRPSFSRKSSFNSGTRVKSFNFEFDIGGYTPSARLANLGRLLLLNSGVEEEQEVEEAGWCNNVDQEEEGRERKQNVMTQYTLNDVNAKGMLGGNHKLVKGNDGLIRDFEPPIYAEY